MNKARRTFIEGLRKDIDELRDNLSAVATSTENTKDEEQEYYDNMPESLQSGDKGTKAEAAIEYLDEAHTALVEAYDACEAAITALENAGEE